MRVLVACEYSGTVRDAFLRAGHYAASCDLLPSDSPLGDHYQCSVLDILDHGWDLMVAHPPCTHLAVSGAKHFARKAVEQAEALEFVRALLNAPIPRICLENPVSVISSRVRKPDQIVQPWMFGEEATKTTCLWLKGLPHLMPTRIVGKGERHITKSGKSLPKWYNLPPSPDRWKKRSATFQGIADAMASQWGADTIYIERMENMNEDKEHTDRLKLVLSEAMKRVPSAVASGSYQVAVQYKADYRKAEKILKRPSPKIADLGWAINAMTGVQMPIDSR